MAFVATVLGKHHDVPVIYDMQSSLPEQLLQYPVFRTRPLQSVLRALERWLLARVDYVMCSSGLEQLVRSIDRDLVVREWWFPGVDALDERSSSDDLRRELGIPSDSRVVVYTGTFDSYQGLGEFKGAVARVLAESPDTHFLIVGARDPEELASFEGSIAEDARKNVHVLSRQPREKIRAFLSMADVLVSPRAGGRNAPLKIFEYMAAGKAIVATDVTAHRGVVDEARAVLVKPTAEDLARGILGLLQDPDRAARLGAAARSYAQEHLGWKQFVERVRSVYEPLFGNAR
jgi:glycosyltransferase involved in cell wall biosynthesis